MATLTGNTIASTYTGLLSVTGAVGADTVEAVTDGAGTSTSLSLSQQRATITLGSGAADDFIVDGTTLVVEGDNNRVGIGTASPTQKLTIEGDTTNAGNGTEGQLVVRGSTDSNLKMMIGMDTSGEYGFISPMKQGTAWKDLILASNGGNVGIGNTVASTINSANSGGNLVVGGGSGNEGITIYSGNGSDEYGILYFADGTSGASTYQGWMAYIHDANALTFATSGSEKMRIDSVGRLIAGGGTAEGTHSERLGVKCLSRYGIFVSDNMSSGTTTIMRMYDTNATTVVGSITSTSSGTAYNTSSDYRLKENEVVISDGLTRLNQLKPYRFNFKTDTDTTVDGFFAHEVAEIVPEAITGEKDAVDDDGNIVSQGIDQSKLVPLLVKALQEADDKIDALTARIEALEA